MDASTVLILAIDTTTRGGSLAVTDDDRLLALLPGDSTRTHAECLPGEIAIVLDRAGVVRSALDLLAVASGPGAFTGLRIGLAATQGLAMALNRPVVGVSALDALAWAADETQMEHRFSEEGREARLLQAATVRATDRSEPTIEASLLAPWMDAQRGDVFAALYQRQADAPGIFPWTVVEPALTSTPEALLERWRGRFGGRPVLFVGDAVMRDVAHIFRAGAGTWRTATPAPLAPAIAQIGRRMALAGHAGPPHALAPIYVRRPDAELERERRERP